MEKLHGKTVFFLLETGKEMKCLSFESVIRTTVILPYLFDRYPSLITLCVEAA